MAILDFVRYHWNVLASNAADMMDDCTIWDLFILRCSWRKILQFWSKEESNLTLFWFWAGFLMIGLGSVGGGHFLGIFRCLCSVVWRFQNYEIFFIFYGKIFLCTCMSTASESGVSATTMWALLGQAVGLKGEGGSRIIWTTMSRLRIFAKTRWRNCV